MVQLPPTHAPSRSRWMGPTPAMAPRRGTRCGSEWGLGLQRCLKGDAD